MGNVTKLSIAKEIIEEARANNPVEEVEVDEAEVARLEGKLEKISGQIEKLQEQSDTLEAQLEDALNPEGEETDNEADVLEAVRAELCDEKVVVVLRGGLVHKATVLDVVNVDGDGLFEVEVFPPNDEDPFVIDDLKGNRIAGRWTNGSFDKIVKAVAKNQHAQGKL